MHRRAVFIALIRGINVGGKVLSMAQLKVECAKAGLKQVQTYIQSGNLVVATTGTASALEAKLEKIITAKFGHEVPVIVRTAEQWKAYLAPPKPFAKAAAEGPQYVHLGLSKNPPNKEAVAALQARATRDEEIILQGDALWIHYPQGAGESKLTPTFLDKSVGSPLTARNFNTVVKLAEMVGISQPSPT